MKKTNVVVMMMIAAMFLVTGMMDDGYAGPGDWLTTKFGGCYKQSEVKREKCRKDFKKTIEKDPFSKTAFDDQFTCFDDATKFLMDCRKEKGKVKNGLKASDMDTAIKGLLTEYQKCSKTNLTKCDEAHPNRKDSKGKADFEKCIETYYTPCQTIYKDSLTDILNKYISTEKDNQ